MEHIERAGIHPGDSACVIPPITIPERHLATIEAYTRTIARELKVVGLINVQYAIANDRVYVLEANPRASRTVPLVSKIANVSMAWVATELMLGGLTVRDAGFERRKIPYYGVKEAVFPFNMLPEVDPVLGPEMRSTGEVLGLADSFGLAFFKAEEATQVPLPVSGAALISVAEKGPAVLEIARELAELGFTLKATRGTHQFLTESGISAELVLKLNEGRPNLIDEMMNNQVQLVINTPIGKRGQTDDSYIRKTAIKYKIPYITTLAAALASARGIAAYRASLSGAVTVKPLQAYHGDLR